MSAVPGTGSQHAPSERAAMSAYPEASAKRFAGSSERSESAKEQPEGLDFSTVIASPWARI